MRFGHPALARLRTLGSTTNLDRRKSDRLQFVGCLLQSRDSFWSAVSSSPMGHLETIDDELVGSETLVKYP
jgi:hypothetical protein